jgi:hypothetical protein
MDEIAKLKFFYKTPLPVNTIAEFIVSIKKLYNNSNQIPGDYFIVVHGDIYKLIVINDKNGYESYEITISPDNQIIIHDSTFGKDDALEVVIGYFNNKNLKNESTLKLNDPIDTINKTVPPTTTL